MRRAMIWIGILGFILAACEGGAMARGVRNQCRSTGLSGNITAACVLTIDSLEGALYTYSVEDDSFGSAADVADVTLNISVGAGSVIRYEAS